jgi:hypothetical protein
MAKSLEEKEQLQERTKIMKLRALVVATSTAKYCVLEGAVK